MELLKETPFEAGWLVWEPRKKESMLTVVVKATYDLPEAGDATLAEAQDFLCGDLYVDDDVERGLRWASDLEPLKPCGECVVVGSYHSQGGQLVERSLASFRIGGLEKSVAVTGDRAWQRGGPTPPTPFAAMPLAWERSFGGPGHEENPIGRGVVADPLTGHVLLPNLEDPKDTLAGGAERPRTYGLAPIPRGFRARTRHAGTYDARWLEERYPGYAEDLDYRLFLASPEDQRVQGFFRGDETIELRHLHPTHAKVSARLPGHRAQAFLCRGGVLTDVGLRLDTVVIDADTGRAHLVWRGVLSVKDPELSDIDHLFVVHQEPHDRHRMADYGAWYARALEGQRDPDALAEPVPVAAPASFGLSADVVAAELARRLREASAEGDRPFDGDAPGAKWAHLDQAMTVRGDDSALQASVDQEIARRRDEEKSSAFRPVFSDALGADVMKQGEELTPEQRLELEMALALADLEEEEKPDEQRDRVREAVRNQESCAGWDLSGANLSGLDLSGGDFTGAILARANLSGAHARGARFDGATLASAELSYAVFHEVSFRGANLSPVRAERVRFAECQFDGADATESYFRNARFARCTFEATELGESELGEAIFEECKLDGVDMSRARLEGATFARSTLVDAWLEGIHAERAIFDGCDCSLLRASEGAELAGASFKRAKLDGARFGTSKLRGASFALASLTRADFQGAMLAQAKLVGCSMRHARFDDAVLVQASLMKSDLYQARFERANLKHADLRGASLFQAELLEAQLEDAQLGLAFLDGTRIA
jgi:uncharacterized protein YjbI with pentapeptide repeats